MATTPPISTGKPQNQSSTPKPKARPTVTPVSQPSGGQQAGEQQAGVRSQSLLQRAEVDPLSLTRADLQRLSISGGQQAVQRVVNHPEVRQARTVPVAMPVFRPMAQLQAKLTVGPVGDRYEQEADRMADRVMRMADFTGYTSTKITVGGNAAQRATDAALQRHAEVVQKPQAYKITPLVQRHPSHAEEEDIQAKRISRSLNPWLQRHPGHAEEEIQAKRISKSLTPWLQRHPSHAEEEDIQAKRLASALRAHVQRKGDGSFEAGPDFEKRMSSQRGGGRPLPDKVRTKMESSFGADFGSVRVHTGSPSVQLNRDIGAQAFTHRNEIHFGAGKFNPSSRSGQHLLAHELTHVVQQNPTVQTKRKGAQTVAKIQASPAQIQRKGFGSRALKGLGTLVQLAGGAIGAGVGAALGAIGGTLGGAAIGAVKGAAGAWKAGEHSNIFGRLALTVLGGVGGLVGGAVGGAVGGTMGGLAMGGAKGFEWLDPRNLGGLKGRHKTTSNKFGQVGPDGTKGSPDTSFSHDMMDRIEDELETLPTAHTKGNSELSKGIRDMPDNPNLPIRGASSYDHTQKQLNIVRPNIPGTDIPLPPALYNMLSKKYHRGVMDKVALSPMFDSTKKARLNTTEDKNLGLGSRSLFGDNMAMNKGNVLKWTVRHEMGHAVDQKIKFTQKRSRMPEFGGWKQYKDPAGYQRLAEAFLEKGGIPAAVYNKEFPYVEQETVRDEEAMAERKRKGEGFKMITKTVLTKRTITLRQIFVQLLDQQLQVNEAVNYVIEKLAPTMKGMADPTQRAKWLAEKAGDEEALGQIKGWTDKQRAEWLEANTLSIRKAADALRIAQLSPFLLADGGPIVINGRVYQFDHYGTWVSYLKAARKNVVSNYQFSSPGEWFAEAYAAYYTPAGDPAREKLSPETRRFFDENLGRPKEPGKLPTPENPKLINDKNELTELDEIEGLDENADQMEEIGLKLAELDKKITALEKGEKYTPNPDAEDGPRAEPKGPPLVGKGSLKPGDIFLQSGGNPAVAAGQGVATVLRSIFKGATVVGLYHAAKDLSRLKYANYVHAAVHVGGGRVAHATNSGVISGQPTENGTFAVFQSSDDALAHEAVKVANSWSTDSADTNNIKTGYDAALAAFGGGFGASSLGPLGKRHAKNLAKGKKVDGMYCSEFAVAVYQVAALNIAKKAGNTNPQMLSLSARSTSPQRLAAKMYGLTKGGNPGWSFKGMYIAKEDK